MKKIIGIVTLAGFSKDKMNIQDIQLFYLKPYKCDYYVIFDQKDYTGNFNASNQSFFEWQWTQIYNLSKENDCILFYDFNCIDYQFDNVLNKILNYIKNKREIQCINPNINN